MALQRIMLAILALILSSCTDFGISSPTRQFSGVWLHEFEGSSFIEGATAIPARRPSSDAVDWLDFRPDHPPLGPVFDGPSSAADRDCHVVRPFRVTFTGHRTQRPFGAGHLGLWRSEVVVHRLASIERLGPDFCYASG